MKKKKIMKTFVIILCVLVLLCASVVVSGFICNKNLKLREIQVKSADLPQSFEGYRIAHVSDLHNTEFGKNNKKLIAKLRDAEPDIIAITGDIVDCHRTDTEIALNFVREACEIAPCYYVAGNHEARVPEDFEKLLAGFEEAGVTVLRNESATFIKGDDSITILGIDDPDFMVMSYFYDQSVLADDVLKEITPENEDEFTLLLSHRPELFEIYKKNNIDLTLSGHAHGGQFRLPFVGGLYAPHQWLFPAYDSGLYTEDGKNLIVSRGIGNSLFPFRLFNPPEIIIAELSAE